MKNDHSQGAADAASEKPLRFVKKKPNVLEVMSNHYCEVSKIVEKECEIKCSPVFQYLQKKDSLGQKSVLL